MGLRDLTFADIYRRNAAHRGDRTAFIIDGQRITHRDYLARVESLAAGLAREGVAPGERLAVLSQNCVEMVELIGAAAMLGAILLPVNFRLNADEIGYVLSDGAPVVVVAGPEYQDLVASLTGTLPSVKRFVAIGKADAPFMPYAELSKPNASLPDVDFSADDGFVIIHTAAVGGRPRGALISQTNLLTAQSGLMLAWALNETDINYGVLPLFHATGLGLLLTLQQAGGTSMISAKFDPAQAVRDITAEKITVMAEFAPMLGNMLDHAKGDELKTLRAVTGLDAPATIERFEAACPDATFWVTFGQSETSGLATFSPFRERPKSAGRPLFWCNIAVVDADDKPLPSGQTGEIVVRGPTVFKGYWRRDEDNARTSRNGWHHTGDMGTFDADGYLFYAGRMPEKELIKTGGENVYPAEVESAIRGHTSIADVAVIGVPDPQWSEAVKAICVRKPGTKIEADEVITFVADKIARYKKPKHVVFVDALPKDAKGDNDRTAIKAAHGQA